MNSSTTPMSVETFRCPVRASILQFHFPVCLTAPMMTPVSPSLPANSRTSFPPRKSSDSPFTRGKGARNLTNVTSGLGMKCFVRRTSPITGRRRLIVHCKSARLRRSRASDCSSASLVELFYSSESPCPVIIVWFKL